MNDLKSLKAGDLIKITVKESRKTTVGFFEKASIDEVVIVSDIYQVEGRAAKKFRLSFGIDQIEVCSIDQSWLARTLTQICLELRNLDSKIIQPTLIKDLGCEDFMEMETLKLVKLYNIICNNFIDLLEDIKRTIERYSNE